MHHPPSSTIASPSSNLQNSSDQLDKVCIVGSGNWGSAIATLVGPNCARLPFTEDVVNMWVYDELISVDGDNNMRKLSEIINERHENVKYLPGIRLPDNVVALPDLETACQNATLLIFVLPHQFLPKLLPIIRRVAHPHCRGVSLIKGLGKCRCNREKREREKACIIGEGNIPKIILNPRFRFLQQDKATYFNLSNHCRNDGTRFSLWRAHGRECGD
jgi:hypothetical protein